MQLIFSKKCHAIVCQAIAIQAVDHAPLYHIQWKPLNVITDNVIIQLMLSVLQSPIPIGKNSN